jgi:hypothetical protein
MSHYIFPIGNHVSANENEPPNISLQILLVSIIVMLLKLLNFVIFRLHMKGLVRMAGFLKEKFSAPNTVTSASGEPALFSQAGGQ